MISPMLQNQNKYTFSFIIGVMKMRNLETARSSTKFGKLKHQVQSYSISNFEMQCCSTVYHYDYPIESFMYWRHFILSFCFARSTWAILQDEYKQTEFLRQLNFYPQTKTYRFYLHQMLPLNFQIIHGIQRPKYWWFLSIAISSNQTMETFGKLTLRYRFW